jgi:hypothetical protein
MNGGPARRASMQVYFHLRYYWHFKPLIGQVRRLPRPVDIGLVATENLRENAGANR